MSKPLTDLEVAQKLQQHTEACVDGAWSPGALDGPNCRCDWEERVFNTFLVLRMIRHSERRACEKITRFSGGARAADKIRDRDNEDE